jgi:SAM-dependent methyltransferase
LKWNCVISARQRQPLETIMDTTRTTGNEQSARWNGAGGSAWVEAQAVIDELFRPIEDLLVEAVPADRAGNVLDVGCGTGSTTVAAARRLAAPGQCVGVDISDQMLTAARARAARDGARASFIHGDAQDHPFEPATFDTIISRFGVMFFADSVRAFTNLRRATSDDGTLRFIAWRDATENPFMTTAERAAAPLLPNLPARRPDAPGQFGFADRANVHRILTDSGWTEIDIRPVDVPCTMPATELKRYATRFGPLGLILHEVPEPTRTRVTETVLTAFDPFVHDAEVRFTAACWIADARATVR